MLILSKPEARWKILFMSLVLLALFYSSGEGAAIKVENKVLSNKPLLDVDLTARIETATFALG